jgi:hypothetical protein
MNVICNNFYLKLIYGIVYLCVLIVFSLHREPFKLILVDEPLISEVVLSQVDTLGDMYIDTFPV